jgi:tetratricopeptide (TPR) repeat protein
MNLSRWYNVRQKRIRLDKFKIKNYNEGLHYESTKEYFKAYTCFEISNNYANSKLKVYQLSKRIYPNKYIDPVSFINNHDNPEVQVEIGQYYYNLCLNDEAMKWFDKATSQNHDDMEMYVSMALITFNSNDHLKADQHYGHMEQFTCRRINATIYLFNKAVFMGWTDPENLRVLVK